MWRWWYLRLLSWFNFAALPVEPQPAVTPASDERRENDSTVNRRAIVSPTPGMVQRHKLIKPLAILFILCIALLAPLPY